MEAGHESMKTLLTSPTDAPARRSRPGRGRSGVAEALGARLAGWPWLMPASPVCPCAGTGHATPPQGSPAQGDIPSSPDDASDEIMDQLVKSVTHNANPRPCTNKERRRSRGNRKSRKSPPCPHALSHPSASLPMLSPVPVLCPIAVSPSHLCGPDPVLCPVALPRCTSPSWCPCPISVPVPTSSVFLCPPCLVPSLCPCPHALPGSFPTGHPRPPLLSPPACSRRYPETTPPTAPHCHPSPQSQGHHVWAGTQCVGAGSQRCPCHARLFPQ